MGVELKPGDRLDFTPVMPVSMTVLEPPADAADASRVELRLGPGAPAVLPHLYPSHEERWEVVSGTLTGRVGEERHALHAGDSLVIPAGLVHGPRNDSSEEVVFRSEHRPGRWFEDYMAQLHVLVTSGAVKGSRSPGFVLRWAVLLNRFQEDQQPPPGIRRLAFRALVALGRLRGYPDSYA